MEDPTCDSTTPDNMEFDGRSPGRAEEELCSSQNIDNIAVDLCKNIGVKRVYDKRHYCLYCFKPKIARHLERAHPEQSDVARALSFPKSSKERKRL